MDGLIKLCEHHTLVLYWTLIITENLLWLTMGLWVAQIQKDLSVVSRSVSCADDDWWFTMLCSWINSDWCFGTGWNNMHNTIWVWLKLGHQIYRLIISFFDNGHKFMGHPAVSDTSISCQVGYRLYIWLYIYIYHHKITIVSIKYWWSSQTMSVIPTYVCIYIYIYIHMIICPCYVSIARLTQFISYNPLILHLVPCFSLSALITKGYPHIICIRSYIGWFFLSHWIPLKPTQLPWNPIQFHEIPHNSTKKWPVCLETKVDQ